MAIGNRMLKQLRERRRRAIADAKKREAAKKKPSSVERREIRAEPKVAVAPKRGTTVKARPPTRTVGRKEPPVSIPKAPPKKKEPTRGRVIASRTEKEDAAKKARAERAARMVAEREAKEAAAKKAREQAAKEAKAEKEREARVRAENQRKEEQRKKERLAAVKRERELKAARAAAAAKKAAEEKAAKEAAAKKAAEAKKQAEIKRAREEAARSQRAEKEAAKKAAEAKAARAAEAKRVAEEKKAAANRRAIAQREEKKAAQERARAAKEAAEAERLREEARRAAALRDAKNARTPARGPAVEKEPKIPMTTMPPPEDIVSRGTVGPVAPRPPAPQRDSEPVIPPIQVTPPPDDVVSRGTVGPVAPRPPVTPKTPVPDSEPEPSMGNILDITPGDGRTTSQYPPRPTPVNSNTFRESKQRELAEQQPTPPVAPTAPKTPVKDPEPEPSTSGPKFLEQFQPDPNMSELDRLKQEYKTKEGTRFVMDPGPEWFQGLKDLATKIKALDPSFESYYLDSEPAPTPTPGPAPKEPTLPPSGNRDFDVTGSPYYNPVPSDPPYTTPGPPKINEPPPGFTHSGGMSTMATVPFYNPTTGEEWIASSGGWSPAPGWVQGSKPANWKPPESKKDEGKKKEPKAPSEPTPPPTDGGRTADFRDANNNGIDDRDEPEDLMPVRPMPRFIDMDPLKGVRETFVPRNILGQSYDPKVREEYEKDVDRKRPNFYQRMPGMGYANPVYQTPTMAVPQVQFGGYGQPMPMAPLAPYAGLAGSPGMYMVEEEEEVRPGGPSRPPNDGVS